MLLDMTLQLEISSNEKRMQFTSLMLRAASAFFMILAVVSFYMFAAEHDWWGGFAALVLFMLVLSSAFATCGRRRVLWAKVFLCVLFVFFFVALAGLLLEFSTCEGAPHSSVTCETPVRWTIVANCVVVIFCCGPCVLLAWKHVQRAQRAEKQRQQDPFSLTSFTQPSDRMDRHSAEDTIVAMADA